jgi:hypothetical protein
MEEKKAQYSREMPNNKAITASNTLCQTYSTLESLKLLELTLTARSCIELNWMILLLHNYNRQEGYKHIVADQIIVQEGL